MNTAKMNINSKNPISPGGYVEYAASKNAITKIIPIVVMSKTIHQFSGENAVNNAIIGNAVKNVFLIAVNILCVRYLFGLSAKIQT